MEKLPLIISSIFGVLIFLVLFFKDELRTTILCGLEGTVISPISDLYTLVVTSTFSSFISSFFHREYLQGEGRSGNPGSIYNMPLLWRAP